MKYICPECGSDIPEDSEFCHHCGRKKDDTIRLDQSGHFVQPEVKCTSCGIGMPQNVPKFRPQMVKYGWIGLVLAAVGGALALVPFGPIGPLAGLFSIYGLGHLYFKKWKRAAWFFFISAFMFVMRYINPEMSLFSQLVFVIFTIFFFILQFMEVWVLAYMPPKTEE